MRRLLIAGNWKMNMLRSEGLALVDGILAGNSRVPAGHDLLVIPPFTLLHAIAERIGGQGLALGAQDLHWEASGAYTSAVSAPMIRDAGCNYVLVGHSERRDCFGDSGEILARKLRAALAADLQPIYCVGEHLEEREEERTEQVLRTQILEVLERLSPEQMRRVTLAYEPVWAIGTGRTATPEVAQGAHAFLRSLIEELHGEAVASGLRILYGGSAKPENAGALLGQADIDGALIGGASLKAESFLEIAAAAIS